MFQFGWKENISAGSKITFPVTFIQNYNVQCIRHWTGTNASISTNLHVYDLETSGFKVGKGNTNSDKVYVLWFAVGKK